MVMVVVIIIFLWQLTAWGVHGQLTFAGPKESLVALWTYKNILATATMDTMGASVVAFIIASVVSLLFVVIAIFLPASRLLLFTVMTICRSAPLIVLAPPMLTGEQRVTF
jgi:ABC-type nitrate/sulfonate/bicarbonate transport system permease component